MTMGTPNLLQHARGTLTEKDNQNIVFAIPGTSYQLGLSTYQPVSTEAGKRIIGTIRAQARRIDVVQSGGKYIEPVYGRPRRIQGNVVAVNPADQTVTIDATVPIVCKTDGKQRAESFKIGDFVACDVTSGSSFTPVL